MLIVMSHSGGQCWSLWPTLGKQCWSLWSTLADNVDRYDPLLGAMLIVITHSGGECWLLWPTLGRNVNRYNLIWGATIIPKECFVIATVRKGPCTINQDVRNNAPSLFFFETSKKQLPLPHTYPRILMYRTSDVCIMIMYTLRCLSNKHTSQPRYANT